MKWLLRWLIRAYQRTPALQVRKCIFHESCSNYVYRRLGEDGVVAGVRAFAERWGRCRGGFSVTWDLYSGAATIRLADRSVATAEEMNLACLERARSTSRAEGVTVDGASAMVL